MIRKILLMAIMLTGLMAHSENYTIPSTWTELSGIVASYDNSKSYRVHINDTNNYFHYAHRATIPDISDKGAMAKEFSEVILQAGDKWFLRATNPLTVEITVVEE